MCWAGWVCRQAIANGALLPTPQSPPPQVAAPTSPVSWRRPSVSYCWPKTRGYCLGAPRVQKPLPKKGRLGASCVFSRYANINDPRFLIVHQKKTLHDILSMVVTWNGSWICSIPQTGFLFQVSSWFPHPTWVQYYKRPDGNESLDISTETIRYFGTRDSHFLFQQFLNQISRRI